MNLENLRIDPQNPGRHYTWIDGVYMPSPFEYVFLSSVRRQTSSFMVWLAYTNVAMDHAMSCLSIWGGCTERMELQSVEGHERPPYTLPLERLADYMDKIDRPAGHSLENLARDGVVIKGWEVAADPISPSLPGLVHALKKYAW